MPRLKGKRLTPRRPKRVIVVNMHACPPLFGVKRGRKIIPYAAQLKWLGDLEWWEIDTTRRGVGHYTPNALWTLATHGVLDIRSYTPITNKDMNYYFE